MKRLPAAVAIAANLYFFGPIATGRVFSSHDIVDAGWPWRATSGVSMPANPLLADFETSALPSLLSWKYRPSNLLWNEGVGGGVPGPANLVEGFLSPFALVPAFLLPAAWVETGILFLKLNFGFLFAYLFLRGERFSYAAATVGACVWAFSPATTLWWLWMQTSVTIAVPLLLLSIRHAAEAPRASRAILGTAASGAVWLSGGYPFAIAYSIFPAALLALDSSPRRSRTLARLAAAASLVALVAAPAALVSWRFLRSSGQIEARQSRAASSALEIEDLRRLVLPDRHVDETAMDRACAVGPAGLALALVGLAASGRRRLKLALGLPAFAVALALFAGGPFRGLLAGIPIVRAASLDRGLFLVALALALLAAAGTEAIERRAAPWAAAMLPLLVAVGLLPAARSFYPTAPPPRAIFRSTPGITALENATGGSRFLATGWTLLPDTAQVFGLRDVRSHLFHETAYRRLLLGADRNVYGRSGTLLIFDSDTLAPGHPDLDRLNVAAIATPPNITLPLPSSTPDPIFPSTGGPVRLRRACWNRRPGGRSRPLRSPSSPTTANASPSEPNRIGPAFSQLPERSSLLTAV